MTKLKLTLKKEMLMDTTAKRNKIESIKDEVGEFHPLLLELLPKLPRVVNSEYTHGPNEKGSDIILVRNNELFNENDYIGIIAKIGKIHTDFTEIERQIDECSMPRLFLNGKKNIYLNEIWVVTNSFITSPAKEKILHKYKDKKIYFVTVVELIKWIDTFLPNYWYDVPLKVGQYLNELWMSIDILDKQLNLFSTDINKVYIEPDIRELVQDYRNIGSKKKRISIYDEIDRKKILFIEGGIGSGKSKLLRKLIDHYSTGVIFTEKKYLPIWTTYSDFVIEYHNDLRELINKKINIEIQKELTDGNTYLILIDAVDEKNLSYDERTEKLKSLIDSTKDQQNIKLIITLRQSPSLTEDNMRDSNINAYEIRPLSMSKIIEFLHGLCKHMNLSNRIIEDLKKSSLFKQLPKNPIAAILLAKLLNDNSKDLPSNITELYNKYTELALGRWDVEKGLESQKEYEASDNILMIIAKYFIDNDLRSISSHEAKEMFKDYLKERNFDIDPEYLFNRIVERSGILIEEPRTLTVFFKHRTFVEFLYAKKCNKGKEDALIIDSRVYDVYWQNVFFYYIGIQKDCPVLLKEIIDLAPKNEGERWLRLVNLPNYLLAGFASPYVVITEHLYKTFEESAILYDDIVNQKIKSPLAVIPEIKLLWLMTMIIRDSYSYEFFKNAIEDVWLQIEDRDIDEKTKCVALFFSSVVALDLEIPNPFDFLIKNHKNDIPLYINFGLLYEGENLKHHSEFLKKQLKKMKQNLKMSPATARYAEALHEKSIEYKKLKEKN